MEPGTQAILMGTLDADKIKLSVNWVTYAVQKVPWLS